MPRALRQLFGQLLEEDPELILFAACFASNHRCRRVIEKLGFEPDAMNLVVRVMHLIHARGRKVQQYRLDRAGFQRSRQASTGSQ